MTDDDNFPIARVTRREPNRTNPSYVLLTVLCPFCERTHHHGGLKDDTDHGHRVADCIHKAPGNHGYMVRETTTHTTGTPEEATMNSAMTRKAIAAYLTETFSAKRQGVWWAIPLEVGNLLVNVTVRGTITTLIEIERIKALDPEPADEVDVWLKEHIWPYSMAWCEHTRRGNTLPTAGTWSSTIVLTGDVLDVLRIWLPEELTWQATARARNADWLEVDTKP